MLLLFLFILLLYITPYKILENRIFLLLKTLYFTLINFNIFSIHNIKNMNRISDQIFRSISIYFTNIFIFPQLRCQQMLLTQHWVIYNIWVINILFNFKKICNFSLLDQVYNWRNKSPECQWFLSIRIYIF